MSATTGVASPIVLVDDHLALAWGLSASLQSAGYPVSVLEPDGDLGERILEREPGLVLLDVDLGPGVPAAVELIRVLRAGGARVVMLTGCTDEVTLGECLAAGASGILPKAWSFDELLDGLQRAIAGDPVTSVSEQYRLVTLATASRQRAEDELAPFRTLTNREAAVLARLTEGLGPVEIADRELVTVTTVRSQLRAIYRKLGVHSQVAAVAKAARARWVPPVGAEAQGG